MKSNRVSKKTKSRRKGRWRGWIPRLGRLTIQRLETRLLLATVSWIADADGFWDVGSNWSTGSVPGQNDDVFIDRPAGDFTITHRSGTALVNSIHSAEKLVLRGGVLDVATTVQVDNNFTINGGTLKNATVLSGSNGQGVTVSSSPNSLLDAVVLNADVDMSQEIFARLRVRNGLTLNATLALEGDRAAVAFENTQTLGGSGTIVFTDQGLGEHDLLIAGGSTLTVGPQMTMQGGRGKILRSGNGAATLINQGTIDANLPGFGIRITLDTFINEGTVRATSDTVDINTPLAVNESGILANSTNGTIAVGGSLTGDTRNADLYAPLGTVLLDGAGTPAEPQLLEVMSEDLGSGAIAFDDNFAYGTLELAGTTNVRLIDEADNIPGTDPESLYVNSLVVPATATLDLNGLNVYVRTAQLAGTISGGSINQIADSGPILFGMPTAGSIAVPGELDDWQFFGRGGRSVTIIVNPGSGGSPAPRAPLLGFAEVQVVDEAENVLAIGASQASGEIVTLESISIPSDGIFGIRIRAEPDHVTDTGNYQVSVWDSTVEEAALTLGQPVTSQIENPFKVDRWLFSASAGQQVRFDLLNATNSGFAFALSGPAGFNGVMDLTDDSGLINLTESGNYVLTAYSPTGQSGAYSFQLWETSQFDLPLGTTFNGTFAGSGQAQLFRVDVPVTSPLMVRLDDSSDSNRNELYASFGARPTRADFQFRHSALASADQDLLIPLAAAGSWYILVYANSVSSPSDFTLTADAAELFLRTITPDHHGNGAEAFLTLTGAGFSPDMFVELVAADSTVFPAGSVQVDQHTQLTATFQAHTVPAGVYTVRARLAGGATSELAGAFVMEEGGTTRFETNLILPTSVGRHALATIYVEYTNAGNVAIRAPLMTLRGTDRALLSLDPSRVVEAFWTSAEPDGFRDTVQILGMGATPGVLQPGETFRIPVHYAGLLQPWDPSDHSVDFTLDVLHVDDPRPIDWAAMKESMRPSTISLAAWDPVFDNIVSQVGTTWGDYVQMLDDNSAYLGRLGQHVADVGQLWVLEAAQAIGMPVLRNSTGVVDMEVSAPGLPITFRRVFSPSIVGRHEQGPLGYGWYWADDWQDRLRVELNGTVVISRFDGSQRRFQPDSRQSSSYFTQAGDYAELTPLGGGTFQLREKHGRVTHYQGDGRVSYVEDSNGNRITATWEGDQLTRLTHSAGQFLQINYSAANRIENLTDSMGRSVVFTYDAADQHLTTVLGVDGYTREYTYSIGNSAAREHALLSIQRPDGTHELFTYNANGQLESTEKDDGAERLQFSYDSTGRVTVTDALGAETELFFGRNGLLAAVEDPIDRRTLVSFDEDLNPTVITDALGHERILEYDDRGNLVLSRNALGRLTESSYTSELDLLASRIDARGNLLHYSYDGQGNLSSITYPNGSIERFTHDVHGNVDNQTNRRGQLIDFSYDVDGRVTRRQLPDGSFTEYRYDARGNLEQAITIEGTTQLEYLDPQHPDLSTKITYPSGRFLQFTYANGRRASMVDQEGFTVTYEYDVAGRLERLRDGSGGLIVQYSYDGVGRVRRKDNGNGTYSIYEYDLAGQLKRLVHHAADTTINSQYIYSYDITGRPTGMIAPRGNWTYEHDALGQLTRAVFTSNDPAQVPDQDLQYEYDEVGNRLRTTINGVTVDYTVNALDQYTQVGTVQHSYDPDGNRISSTSEGVTETFSYDAVNRLIRVEQPTDTWTYQYDALGHRVTTTRDGTRTEYLIDPAGWGNVVGQYSESGNLIANYVHGLELTSRVAAADEAAYYDFDALGSIVGLSSSSGAYLNQYDYLPFGGVLNSTLGVENDYLFVGAFGVMAEANGLAYMRNRFYDPVSGVFTAVDPLRFTQHAYMYAGNSPLRLIDPTGLEPPIAGDKYLYRPGDIPWCGMAPCIPPDSPPDPPSNPPSNPPSASNGCELGFLCFPPPSSPIPSFDCDTIPFTCGPFGLPPSTPPPNPPDVPPPDPPSDTPSDGGSSGTVGSVDPNDKMGPAGFGPAGYIKPDRSLPYRINFENEESATAPAQRVVITDQLDADLDWDTFAWTGVGWGDVNLTVPAGLYYRASVPMTFSEREFQVDVELSVNTQSGELLARFQSLDPSTSLPPDVLTGFLPPEDGTGRGQGFISYIVEPLESLPTGTDIRNIALITFDTNEPIATNQVDPLDPSQGTDSAKEARNTIDAGRPTSSVQALPTTVTSKSFLVEWTGTDDPGGSGIAVYDLFVSANGGPFEPVITGTTNTSLVFDGENGRTYEFYSVATDNVGHRQPTPAGGQAATRVDEVPDVVGDFNGDGDVDAEDIDLVSAAVRVGDDAFDLNQDGVTNSADRRFMIETILNTRMGDSNLDGIFDSSDLVFVFQRGQYEDQIASNSGWAGGDWDGDGDFTSSDLVAAFQTGAYVSAAQSLFEEPAFKRPRGRPLSEMAVDAAFFDDGDALCGSV